MKHTKWKFSPAAIGMLSVLGLIGLGVLGWLYLRSHITVEIEPIPAVEPTLQPQESSPSPAIVSTPPLPPPTEPPTSTPQTAIVSPANPALSGSVRVSNRTEHPIRVILLHQKTADATTAISYEEPAHWDFAPQEGSSRGLILSLPQGNLRLREGDVIAAFAQDGSRRYWGPYVVGKTGSPFWDEETTEWELVLSPQN